jgi:nitroreductase
MRDILEIMRDRHSSRVPYDPKRRVPDKDLQRILEAARWAPTAHNMQNFQVIIVDDEATLTTISAIRSRTTKTFLEENYQQLSFSEGELLRKRTGLLATMFPASWQRPDAEPQDVIDAQHALLGSSMQNCPLLLLVIYDTRKRAPASDEDVLGIMSLGCVMQNMWLMAEAAGIGMQILSALSAEGVEDDLRRILQLPSHMKIAFACRLGYPAAPSGRYLRVRREIQDFAHQNRYRKREF